MCADLKSLTARLREISGFVSSSNGFSTRAAAADVYAEQRFRVYRCAASAAAAQEESRFIIRNDNSRVL